MLDWIRRKRVKPAVSTSARTRDSLSPSVPNPAPPGSESALDMHDSTLMPYIIAVIGFLATFCSKLSSALISAISHTPSGPSARRIAPAIAAGSVMSCRQSKVLTKSSEPSSGSPCSAALWNAAFARPRSARRCSARASDIVEMS